MPSFVHADLYYVKVCPFDLKQICKGFFLYLFDHVRYICQEGGVWDPI